MTYTVSWTPRAQNDLATLWMNAPDRAAVTTASNTIDAVLRRDPYADSESRTGPTRIMIVPPLAVAFDVSEQDRLGVGRLALQMRHRQASACLAFNRMGAAASYRGEGCSCQGSRL